MTTVTISKEQINDAIEVQKAHIAKLKEQLKKQVCNDIDNFNENKKFDWGILSTKTNVSDTSSIDQACYAIAHSYNNIYQLRKFAKVQSINIDFDEYSEITECVEIEYITE